MPESWREMRRILKKKKRKKSLRWLKASRRLEAVRGLTPATWGFYGSRAPLADAIMAQARCAQLGI